MKPFRPLIMMVCILASFIAHASQPSATKAKGATNQCIAPELQPLQGTWEGAMVGETTKITITITGDSLHFHRDTNFWFETTIVLPAGADPKQLHATIKKCPTSQADSIGQVVGAIFKIEDSTLTLIAYAINEDPPKTFATEDKSHSRYELRKASPQKQYPQLPGPAKPTSPFTTPFLRIPADR